MMVVRGDKTITTLDSPVLIGGSFFVVITALVASLVGPFI